MTWSGCKHGPPATALEHFFSAKQLITVQCFNGYLNVKLIVVPSLNPVRVLELESEHPDS